MRHLKDANITIMGSTYVMDVNGTVANASVNFVDENSAKEMYYSTLQPLILQETALLQTRQS